MYGFQVKVENSQTRQMEWRDVHPTGGQPYRYETRDEAERMARICYGTDSTVVRVISIP